MLCAAATISTPTSTPDGAVHDDGIWVSSGIVRESRPSEHVRVFEVPAGSPHRVLVVDAAARNLTGVSLRHITSCDHDSWYPMASYDRAATKPAGFSCWFARATADSQLSSAREATGPQTTDFRQIQRTAWQPADEVLNHATALNRRTPGAHR